MAVNTVDRKNPDKNPGHSLEIDIHKNCLEFNKEDHPFFS